jgi:FkbM family methyltransferase
MKKFSQLPHIKFIRSVYIRVKVLGFRKSIYRIFSELLILFYYRIISHSLSQRGEDILMNKYFFNKKRGFYIDIGANDPWEFSNTGYFYKKGWRGITVEPNVNLWKKLKDKRPNDIHINGLIEKRKGKATFYAFDPHTLSTTSPSVMKSYREQGYKLVSANKIQAYTLVDIFSMIPRNQQVDILSIDTEGNELTILKSNNWSIYRPNVICIETQNHDITEKFETHNIIIEQFLYTKGYKKIASTGLNSIFAAEKVTNI